MENQNTRQNRITAAHEVGHTFGLLDLYESYNTDKLMFGTNKGTAIKPSASDIKGGLYATRK